MRRRSAGNPNEGLIYFCGMMISFIITRLDDKLIGTKVKNNVLNREHMILLCNEARIQMESINGNKPTITDFAFNNTTSTIEKKWYQSLHWKKWKLQRVSSPERYL
mmetsp:Transcript_7652/g.10869  ORF Transcript_7652/g.10869 Transcript_7652/m.10869 type:complete len:106 (+) Transcript_7652:3801-4118(+)